MKNFVAINSIYILLLFIPSLGKKAWALPLLTTDDAGIVTAQHCQMELSYKLHNQASHTALVSPACNLLDQAELSLSLNSDQGERSYAIQLKRPLFIDKDFSVAASVQFEQGDEGNWHFNIPSSFYLSDQWQIDANIGYNQLNHHSDQIIAVASTYSLNSLNQFSVELSKTNSEDNVIAQLLYHYHIVPEKLSLYTAYGQSLTADPPVWMGFGLSWTTPTF